MAAGPLYGLLALLASLFPPKPNDANDLWVLATGTQALLCNLALMAWFLLCVGALLLVMIRRPGDSQGAKQVR